MVDAAKISKKDIVLEIGPGLGSLTELLAEHAKKVLSIEKDRELIPILQKKFSEQKKVKIIEGDILRLDLKKLSLKSRYKIVANIPYYITGKFLRLFLGEHHLGVPPPSTMVLMVQKEVAQRIIARPEFIRGAGKESLLSLSVKAYGKPSIVRIVPRGAFSPPPKVDSAIIAINNISDVWFQKNHIDSSVFFKILRDAFQKKRKTLKNSIKIDGKFGQKRPEDLSLDDWAGVFRTIYHN